MAAPTPTARSTPTGPYFHDGFATHITFALLPTLHLWEIGVKPTGDDGGDPIKTSTMFNVKFHTKAPRALIDNDDITFRAAYHGAAKDEIRNTLLNRETTITVQLPNGTTEAVFGWLRKTEWAEHVEGEMPIGTFTVTVSNYDPVGKVEAGPATADVPGT